MIICEKLNPFCPQYLRKAILGGMVCLLWAAASTVGVQYLRAQQQKIVWTRQQEAIVKQIRRLRQLPDKKRGRVTKQLALEIRQMPTSENKVRLAIGLATLSTEGDPGGRETVQAVATTLAGALGEHPVAAIKRQSDMPYRVLASMVHFEHLKVSLNSPEFAAALSQLERQDQRRQQAGFTLTDLEGHEWTLKSLRGKVVLVNFWATWCPPCRKEIPDLNALYKKFKRQGLVILGVSDDDATKVGAFARSKEIVYPVLLDPGSKVKKLYAVEGIPMSFVYNRDGKLVAESMDMRTRKQFLDMLAEAGLK